MSGEEATVDTKGDAVKEVDLEELGRGLQAWRDATKAKEDATKAEKEAKAATARAVNATRDADMAVERLCRPKGVDAVYHHLLKNGQYGLALSLCQFMSVRAPTTTNQRRMLSTGGKESKTTLRDVWDARADTVRAMGSGSESSDA